MPRLAANLSFLFKDRPFLERFSAAASSGFKAVEFMFAGDTGYELTAHEVKNALHTNGLQQILLNAPPGDWSSGERGLGGLPDSRDSEFKQSIDFGLEFATQVGCQRMHVMAGLMKHDADEERFVERLKWASTLATDAGVTLCVEPLNASDFPGYLVPDVTTALRIIEKVDSAHVKLQFDLYHYAMSEGVDGALLEGATRKLVPLAAHVQLANPPGRNEPGVGDVDFPPLLRLLDDLGYDGHVGCEYKPAAATSDASFDWARNLGYLP